MTVLFPWWPRDARGCRKTRPERVVALRSNAQPLREGFTTGTAAAGAALAALTLLCECRAPQNVSVPLPPFAPPSLGRDALFAGCCPRDWRRLPVTYCAPGPAPELADLSVNPEAALRPSGNK